MTIDGWGLDGWGLEPWGGVVPQPPLAIERAVAISTKEVEVDLNRDPQAIAPTIEGDGLNPATWTIQRLDTAFLFSVVAARQEGPQKLIVSVLQDLGSEKVTHRISTTTLLDSDGNPITAPILNSADFPGLLSTETRDRGTRARQRTNAIRDVANRPAPSSELDEQFGGTLVVNSAGDYELESGQQLIKKLIVRRLITKRGDFFHLPDYGVGLNVKEPLPAVSLVKLRADIIAQVLREPEVEEADATLIQGAGNDLSISVRARLRASNASVSIGIESTPSGLILT